MANRIGSVDKGGSTIKSLQKLAGAEAAADQTLFGHHPPVLRTFARSRVFKSIPLRGLAVSCYTVHRQ
jgi:hypothetical protein